MLSRRKWERLRRLARDPHRPDYCAFNLDIWYCHAGWRIVAHFTPGNEIVLAGNPSLRRAYKEALTQAQILHDYAIAQPFVASAQGSRRCSV